MRTSVRSLPILLGLTLCLGAAGLATTPAAYAQASVSDAAEIQRMINAGMVEALRERFKDDNSPDACRAIALAQANKASRITDDARRNYEFELADVEFEKWLAAVRTTDEDELVKQVDVVAVRLARASMILSQWARFDLDQFELTDGRVCQRERLQKLLKRTCTILAQAAQELRPLDEAMKNASPTARNRYLALGIYDTVPRLSTEVNYSQAWAQLMCGIALSPETSEGEKCVRTALSAFQGMLGATSDRATEARCRLGLAIALRHVGRDENARVHFRLALDAAEGAALPAQIRYEYARSEIDAGRFTDARKVLAPLLRDRDAESDNAEQGALFCTNLAHLWNALSYLKQADAARPRDGDATRGSGSAERDRQRGLALLTRLATRGGSWPAIVQIFVEDAITPGASVDEMSAVELLLVARTHREKQEYEQAVRCLQAGLQRSALDDELAADIQYELGLCQYRLGQQRAAAEAFEAVARTYVEHPLAAAAISSAYQLWARVAEESGAPEDYLRLARLIEYQLQHFPKQAEEADAVWWLPVALQAGGDYAQAIERFAEVPTDSPHSDEADYRRAICRRLQFEAERGELADWQLQAKAKETVNRLERYAWQAVRRAKRLDDPEQLQQWAAAAVINAAEVQLSNGVEDFESAIDLLNEAARMSGADSVRQQVLTLRIRALCGLRRYQEALGKLEDLVESNGSAESAATLAPLARGILDELERLEADGKKKDARELAQRALPTFERLVQWVSANPQRARYTETVLFAIARVRLVADDFDGAEAAVAELLKRDTHNGGYLRLHALVLTQALTGDSTDEQVEAARAAWADLLRRIGLKTDTAAGYWEARYQMLRLTLRLGNAAEVETAISQERIWRPKMGGKEWAPNFDRLYEQAKKAQRGGAKRQSKP